MRSFRQKVIECAGFITSKTQCRPKVGFITGTGLSDTLTGLDILNRFEYEELPHFPRSTVDTHKGCLIHARLEDKEIFVFQGRCHLYEGYSPQVVTFPVRLLQELGGKVLILSNAAGGINLNFRAGDIMLVKDHINLTGTNPLTGPDEPEWGPRFPYMTRVYDTRLTEIAAACAQDLDLDIQQGTYAGLTGPSLETPAETRYLKTIGADAVGFSTVMEAIAGVHAGMRMLGLSLITNINNPDAPAPTTLEAVVETAAKSTPKMDRLIRQFIKLFALS